MFPISDRLTLEVGNMYQPSLDCVKSHEEMWLDPVVGCVDADGKKRCVVLRLRDDERHLRGVVVRVGQFCQGIVMRGDECTVERWEFASDAEGGGEVARLCREVEREEKEVVEDAGERKWRRTARIGDLFLPCAATWRTEALSVGGNVQFHDYNWNVEEVWVW
jgi:hypothetical protein